MLSLPGHVLDQNRRAGKFQTHLNRWQNSCHRDHNKNIPTEMKVANSTMHSFAFANQSACLFASSFVLLIVRFLLLLSLIMSGNLVVPSSYCALCKRRYQTRANLSFRRLSRKYGIRDLVIAQANNAAYGFEIHESTAFSF